MNKKIALFSLLVATMSATSSYSYGTSFYNALHKLENRYTSIVSHASEKQITEVIKELTTLRTDVYKLQEPYLLLPVQIVLTGAITGISAGLVNEIKASSKFDSFLMTIVLMIGCSSIACQCAIDSYENNVLSELIKKITYKLEELYTLKNLNA